MHLEKREKKYNATAGIFKNAAWYKYLEIQPQKLWVFKSKKNGWTWKNIYIFSKNINLRHFYFQAIHLVPDTVPGNNLLSYSKVFFSSTVRILFGE